MVNKLILLLDIYLIFFINKKYIRNNNYSYAINQNYIDYETLLKIKIK